jgi:hypothetical protein
MGGGIKGGKVIGTDEIGLHAAGDKVHVLICMLRF